MNRPSIFGSIVARIQIPGIFPGLKVGAPTFIGKNIGAAVQLTQYADVSLSRIHNRMGADKFTAQQINSGKLS